MIRYLLDTGPAADFVYRRDNVFERTRQLVADGNRIGTTPIVIAELWAGVENSASKERNSRRLKAKLSDLTFWPFEYQTAKLYGRIAAELRQIGRPMQQNDIQIAAVAFSLQKCVVVSYDSDLAAVPGLEVENWREVL